MKKYVFIVPSVANMGGAQMYIRNKVLYLRKRGWIVDVILAQGGVAKLTELQEFDCVIPELAFDILYYSKKKKIKVIETIIKRINTVGSDGMVIESTCISESSWAEAVASRIGAKHISFLLQEHNAISNKGMQDFFLFKHQRKELIGISETSLSLMFQHFHPISKEESFWLPAYCNNVEADITSPFIEQVKGTSYDYMIGMLSRLEKPFVKFSIEDLCGYANKHEDKLFLFLLMGDAPTGSGILTQIQGLVKGKAPNVKIIATGYLYPVPTRLLEMCDVFLVSAGSSWVCKRSGVPTITYDGNDMRPIGVLGRTTMNSLFRGSDEPEQDFDIMMDEILVEKKYKKEAPNYREGLPDFSNHMKALEETAPRKEYFDVESIKPESKEDLKLKWALAVIGPENYLKLGFLKEKWEWHK